MTLEVEHLSHLQPAIIASKSPWKPQMQPWLQTDGGYHQSKGNFNQEQNTHKLCHIHRAVE